MQFLGLAISDSEQQCSQVILFAGIFRSKCARLGTGNEIKLVCSLNNTDSRNHFGDVTGSMASVCHLHSSNCYLHMVPGKRQTQL